MSKFELILIIVLIIIVLFVGAEKIPKLARGVGEAGKELKKGFKDDDSSKDNDKKDNKTENK